MTENKKSAVFGGIVMAVVAIILVLIIVFAVSGKSDGSENAEKLAQKVMNLRIFEDENHRCDLCKGTYRLLL